MCLPPPPTSLSRPEALQAAADYLAKDFMQSGKTPDYLTDVYAIGCSLYELIAGQPPFAGSTIHEDAAARDGSHSAAGSGWSTTGGWPGRGLSDG